MKNTLLLVGLVSLFTLPLYAQDETEKTAPEQEEIPMAADVDYETGLWLEAVHAFQKELNDFYASEEESPMEAEDRAKFEGHPFFPIAIKYRVSATFTRTPDSKPFQMKTSTTRLPIYQKYGHLTFTLEDSTFQLNVYQNHNLKNVAGYENYLFLPYNDQTNGDTSYGGGRYIDMEIQEGDTWIIDFNKSYNPYCAYSKKYSCPIPPVENFMNIAIHAGVKFVY